MARRRKPLIRWTPADLKTLRSLAGKPVKQIAKALKRSEASVRYKAWEKKISLTRKG